MYAPLRHSNPKSCPGSLKAVDFEPKARLIFAAIGMPGLAQLAIAGKVLVTTAIVYVIRAILHLSSGAACQLQEMTCPGFQNQHLRAGSQAHLSTITSPVWYCSPAEVRPAYVVKASSAVRKPPSQSN